MNEPIKNRTRSIFTVAALTAAVGGGYLLRGGQVTAQGEATPGRSAPVVQTAASREASSIQKAFADVARAAEPAVVTITTEGGRSGAASRRFPRRNPFGPNAAPGTPRTPNDLDELFKEFQRNFGFTPNSAQREQIARNYLKQVQDENPRGGGGLGSGMIYRNDGLILTNAHVVRGADTVTVKMNDGREFKRAKVLGTDERTDIAVVKVNATNLPTVKFGTTDDVQVGDWAIAVGNPYGLAHTVTVGIISAKAREVDIDPRTPGDYLQTDASINPGNSGGPLMDINGRVIGVNNAIYSQSGGNVGIGFAIPVDTARSIADRLVKDGKIVRGYLGVQISTIENVEQAQQFGLDASARGVLVQEVSPNTPGSKAGLQAGDVITAFNGTKVTRSPELQRLVGDQPVNSRVTLTVQRAGQTVTLNAVLTQLPEEGASKTTPSKPDTPDSPTNAPSALGMRLRPLTPTLANRYGVPAGTRGVVVVRVDENSPASDAGITEGDVIEKVAQTPVSTPQEVQTNISRILNRQAEGDKTVALYVNTKGTKRFVVVNANQ